MAKAADIVKSDVMSLSRSIIFEFMTISLEESPANSPLTVYTRVDISISSATLEF